MPEASYAFLTTSQKRLCFAIAAACVVVGVYNQIQLWQLDANGLSIAGKRLPYWDFSNLWAGSLMTLQGKVNLLFDVDAYRRELDTIFAAKLPAQEWSYPPSILLLGIPLALLPISPAFIVWSAGTLFLLHMALRPFRLPAIAHLFVLLSPAIWSNQMFGQNGALTAALLIAGLFYAPTRPVLAGIFIGLLTIKPHLGILVPFCLLASRNVTAIVSAAATALAMFVATGLFFGFDVWVHFLTETRALMTRIMEAPYPQAYHTHAATIFVTMRSLGASLAVAYAVQLVTTALAIAGVCWLWRPANLLDHRSRVCITSVLVIAATPYGSTYDTAPLYLAVAWFLLRDRAPVLPFYAVIWLFALVAPSFHDFHISVGIFAPLVFAGYLFYRHVLAPGRSAHAADGENTEETSLPAAAS